MYQTLRLTMRQIEEALSDANAYFYFVQHGRPHLSALDLIRHYIAHAVPYEPHLFQVDETCAVEGVHVREHFCFAADPLRR